MRAPSPTRRSSATTLGRNDNLLPPIACFSHVPWESKQTQPREVLTRLAARGCRVFYLECAPTDAASGAVDTPAGVMRLFIQYRYDRLRRAGMQKWLGAQKVAVFLRRCGLRLPVLWFTHPSLFALGYSHDDSGIVYDLVEDAPMYDPESDDMYFDELMMLAEADLAFARTEASHVHLRRMCAVLRADLSAAARRGGQTVVREPVLLNTAAGDDSLADEIESHLQNLYTAGSGLGSR